MSVTVLSWRWLKVGLLTLGLLSVVGLSACGSGNSSGSPASSGNDAGQTTAPVSGDENREGDSSEGLSAAVSALRANGGLHGDAYAAWDGTAAEMVISTMGQDTLEQLVPGVSEEEFAEAIEEGYARIWLQAKDSVPIDYCGFRGGKPTIISPDTQVQEGEELGFSFGCSGEH
ncbi:MAG TPA: hypothetical protein VFN89_12810 [Solirubrobacterales bacterium]|nr:hypothetical protein [Solirubrobacterales bacterium]